MGDVSNMAMREPGFLPYPKKYYQCASDCSLDEMWEWPRALVVSDWKIRSNVTWDACSKFFVAAKRVGWKSLSEMESVELEGGQLSNRAGTLVVEFGHGLC